MSKRCKFIFIIIVITVSIALCFSIPFILDHLVFANNTKSSLDNSDWSSFLGSYIGGILGGVATLIAVIISLNISKSIQEESELRENSLIVFYDLVLGLTDLKKLYINCKNKKFENVPLRMYFSDEWIKNVAKISGNIKDTDKMYKLYGDLLMLGDEVENKSYSDEYKSDLDIRRYEKIIERIANKVFSDKFLKSDMKEYEDNDDIELDNSEDLNADLKRIILNLNSKLTKGK